ncbi:MAG TPA: NfeD family protein [Candidatus Babeliales bacterium]|nr:NfeD family protein [Candidatus Babeliales bacterium]
MAFIWLIFALFFLLLEMGSPGLFYFLSFFFGGVIAALLSVWVTDPLAQVLAFFSGSIASFAMLWFWVKKEHTISTKTNVYALQGKKGIVLKEIAKNNIGTVKVGGEVWSAKSVHAQDIRSGAVVEIVRVQGAHLVVVESNHHMSK